ncbi:tRNA isopentenyltransferase [Rhizoctonia solani AG-1 IA]|uniref:tRNA isopentenyltransferase n=1 Tax=Thanatephorus cucumeris (strain AG1-IA) TaxID=983506 RepID=L8X379_THACA|nr:tRNA isopentenyltransferase [Rhizoctonia solani AG-1 IA]
MTQNSPLVAVVGSTGTGKSRLSIELAIALRAGLGSALRSWKNSKIINADAMQVYKGLDLVTNKVTESEMNGIEHTLFDFRDLDHEYVITEWVTDATAEISTAHANNQLPIVVGGTTYWVQHLLFANGLTSLKDSIHDPVHESSISTSLIDLPSSLQQLFNNLPPRGDGVDETMAFDLHNLLSHLDPVTATRWHWKDTRKVLRSLNIIRESNKTVQDAYEAQLDPISRQVISSAENRGQMTGLNQAIGYKEFEAYLNDTSRPQAEFNRGVVQMKTATRQYAARQVKWLKSRLLPAIAASSNVHIVLLNIRDVECWETDILKPSLEHLKNFLNGCPPPEPEPGDLLRDFIEEMRLSAHQSDRRKIRCDVCTTDSRKPVMLDEKTEWDIHRKSRTHRRKESKDSRKEAQLKRQEEIPIVALDVHGSHVHSFESMPISSCFACSVFRRQEKTWKYTTVLELLMVQALRLRLHLHYHHLDPAHDPFLHAPSRSLQPGRDHRFWAYQTTLWEPVHRFPHLYQRCRLHPARDPCPLLISWGSRAI